MPYCAVKSCKNYASKCKKPQGITYHAFPRDEYRKFDWIQIIRNSRGESDWNPSTASTVCSAHFDDDDFKTTAKGLRCLALYAIPKRLLSNSQEIETQSTSSPILQVPVLAEELTSNGYCRLCAASNCTSSLVNLQSDEVLKKLVVNMSNRLNTNIDFSKEHLPTTICYVCIKALYTAYDFVVGIDLAQTTLNNTSMQKCKSEMPENEILGDIPDFSSTSLQKISTNKETAVQDAEQPSSDVPSTTISLSQVSSNTEAAASDFVHVWLHEPSTPTPATVPSPQVNIGAAASNFAQRSLLESHTSNPSLLDSLGQRRLRNELKRNIRIMDALRKKIKILNQKVRRLTKRNESHKNIINHYKKLIHKEAD